MKIAVTSQNRKTVTEHAGRCRRFWVFEITDRRIGGDTLIELPKEKSFHDSPSHDEHPLDGIDVLISGGMGQGLVNRLARRGIKSVVTDTPDPRQAVELYLEGSLKTVDTGVCEHDGCTCDK